MDGPFTESMCSCFLHRSFVLFLRMPPNTRSRNQNEDTEKMEEKERRERNDMLVNGLNGDAIQILHAT